MEYGGTSGFSSIHDFYKLSQISLLASCQVTKRVRAISKKSFDPISLLDVNFKSSKLGTRSKRVGSERSKEILEYVSGLKSTSAFLPRLNFSGGS
jgi:hypothetical protein